MGEGITLILEPFGTNSSKQAQRRLAHQTEEIHRANHCLRVLRGLSEGGISDDVLQPRVRVRSGGLPPHELNGTSFGHRSALRVMKAVKRLAPAPDRFRGRVALERLLGIAPRPGPYSIGAAGPDSASGQQLPKGALCRAVVEEISLPVPGTVGIDIRRLSPRVCDLLDHYEDKMLRVSGEELLKESEIRPYTDPGLQVKGAMAKLCLRLYQAGMLTTSSEQVGLTSLFTVVKKWEGEQLSSRLIFDERLENLHWHTPA